MAEERLGKGNQEMLRERKTKTLCIDREKLREWRGGRVRERERGGEIIA